MKNIFTLLLCSLWAASYSQTVLFSENFDAPSGPDSVSTIAVVGTNITLWNDTSSLSVSSGNAYHIKGSVSNTEVAFETNSFSTVGHDRIYLRFSHIAKMYSTNQGIIEVSVNNGTSWTNIASSPYYGGCLNYGSQGSKIPYFNQVSYPSWNFAATTGPNSIPTNQWWKEELFDITSLVTSSGTGYSSVKLRFRAKFLTPVFGGNFYLSGWYVDDVEIFGTPCEIIPPTIERDTSLTSACHHIALSGLKYNPSTFSQSNAFDIQDNNQVDSARLVEVINDTLVRYSSLSLTPGNTYLATFTGYNSFDTIQWKIEVYDSCGNSVSYPDTGHITFYFGEDFPKCATGNCGAEHNFIDSFPWSQDFEGSEWVPRNLQIPPKRGYIPFDLSYDVRPLLGQNWGWTVLKGPTPTNQAGPLGDHSSGNGTYLYTEFQGQSSLSGTAFILPCIDLRDSASKLLSFYYHMYGSDTRRLSVQIDSTNTTGENWHNYHVIDGEQQLSSADLWKKAIVDLSPYKGKIIKLRLFGTIHPNTNHRCNIAIDDLLIEKALSTDIELHHVESPVIEEIHCLGTSGVNVSVKLYYKGFNPVGSVPLAYQLNSNPVVYDTVNLSGKSTGFDTTFTFGSTVNLPATTAHTLRIWSQLPGDQNFQNDTVVLSVPVSQTDNINTFPYFENFESALPQPDTPAIYPSAWDWNVGDDSLIFFEIVQGPLLNERQGPYPISGIHGRCLAFKATTATSSQSYAEMQTNCVDLTALSNPVLQFQYHSLMMSPEVLVREYGAQNWIAITQFPSTVAAKNSTEGLSYDLSAYAGKVAQIKIRVKNTNSNNSLFVLDNICIREKPSRDLELRRVRLRDTQEGVNSIPTVSTEITNWSSASLANVYKVLRMELTNKCAPSAPMYYATSDSTISMGTGQNFSLNFSNLTFSTTIPAGEYEAKMWIETPGDTFYFNDTAYQDIVCLKPVTLPYLNDFEDCFKEVNIYGKALQWQVATPDKNNLDSAYEGAFSIITNASHPSLTHSGSYDYFELPPIIGMDTLYGARLSFWQNFDFQPSGGFGVVEIGDGQTYTSLMTSKAYGINWKSHIATISDAYNLGFVGNSNGWIHSSYPLDEFKTPGAKRIRFVTRAINEFGWAIDSIAITYPKQNSGSPTALSFPNKIPWNGNNPVELALTNTAYAPLMELTVNIMHNGQQLLSETINFGTPLQKDSTRIVTLSQPLALDSTINELIIITQNPNNRVDERPTDDTLVVAIHLPGRVDSVPQCFDFESANDFAPDQSGSLKNDWRKGQPAKVKINSSYSGSHAWFTAKNQYAPLQNAYLYTPEYNVKGGTCYRFSFWHQYDIEKNFDGGQVEFSMDNGGSWQQLGHYWSTDTHWYNTQYIQSLDGFKPGWSGTSSGWKQAYQVFKIFWNGSIKFRFRFASNATGTGEGWAIDDVCLEPVPGSCTTIGLAEKSITNPAIDLYPNPTQGNIHLKSNLSGYYQIRVYNAKAGLIKSWGQLFRTGREVHVPVTDLPPGVYWISVSNADFVESKKFVVIR